MLSDPVLIVKVIPSDLRPVLRAMKKVFLFTIVRHGVKNSICSVLWCKVATLPMVSRLANYKSEVFWCIATMTDHGYHVIISKPWENFPTQRF